jgi:glycosyltransferase involved in cell wall biosynthesis
MVQRGHRVIAIAPNFTPDVLKSIRALGATPKQLQMDNQSLNIWGMLRASLELWRIVQTCRPDVLISYTIKPVLLGAIIGRLARVPKVVSMITGVGYAFTDGPELKRKVSRWIATRLYRFALRWPHSLVFQNRDDEELFRQSGLITAEQRVFLVNGSGVDLSHYAPAPLPSTLAFLMISRFLKDKGIREFAAAARRLTSEFPEVGVHLVGYRDGSPDSISASELQEIRECGVRVHNAASDVRPHIARCSVYVLPSYREGTPRTVLEAMAMGRAIITTDAPGCRETVLQGINGFLVPPRDSGALYEAMRSFLLDPGLVPAMGKRSRAMAEERFDVAKVNAELLGVTEL